MELPFITNDTLGKLPLLIRRPFIAVPYITVLGAAAILGTAGNLLIVGTLATDKKNKNVGNHFIINLALSDLVVTALINPFAIVGITEGKQFFNVRTWLCEALANLCIASCVSSMLNIGYISINRYVYICHNSIYNHIFTRKYSLLMCLSTWIAGILLDLPNHTGWSRHEFDAKSHKCLLNRSFNYSYTVLFVTCCILIPLTITTAFYLKIFLFIGKAKARLGQHKNDSIGKALASTMRQAKMMCIIFVAFTTCWTPYAIVLLFDKYDTYPLEVHLFASMIAHIHASLNFVIYGCSNSRIRSGYIWFIREKLCCCPTDTSQAVLFDDIQRNDLPLLDANDKLDDGKCNRITEPTSNNLGRSSSFLLNNDSCIMNDVHLSSSSNGFDRNKQDTDNQTPQDIEMEDAIVHGFMCST